MPRQALGPKKKSKRKNWNTEDLVKAIKAVRNKDLSFKKASKMFLVPRPTLQRLVRISKPPEEAAVTKLARKPYHGK